MANSNKVKYVKKSSSIYFLTLNETYTIMNEMTANDNYVEIQIINDLGELVWLSKNRFQILPEEK